MSRRRPRLVIVVPLEGRPRVSLYAESAEDERRLRAWLRHSPFATWPVLARLLDRLDEADRMDAA